ncbi:MAG: beta-galactosidase trimerization domain-containing protein [Opitutaceae bacterium]|nr:beta-galactosidase trimerization domain-containing protein [Opitutaceae bacterium]
MPTPARRARIVCLLLLAAAVAARAADDPFLHARYDALNDSPMQQRLRALRPWPVGVVFIQRPGMTLADIRAHFRLIREHGFTCLKQIALVPGQDERAVLHAALDEGLVPWWYDDASSELPTPDLLRSLGLPADLPPDKLRIAPAWRERQLGLLRARIDRTDIPPKHAAAHETDGLPGTLKRDQYGVTPEAADLFADWLRQRYTAVPALRRAWNFDFALVRSLPWETWTEVRRDVVDFVNAERQDYRRIVDVYRFRADLHLAKIRHSRDEIHAFDPLAPQRFGGEMSLFLPFAARSTDMEGIASLMREGGSFYPSMHPGWHYEEADFEYARPTYMQASLAVDWFKGGWSAAWEATGGPQQLSGGKAPFVPEVRDQIAGFTIDENTIQQLMLTWVAAGFKGFGQWCWNARGFGWEGGEYALLDRNQRPTARTVAAGKIGQACQRLRDELWAAHKEPLVGVFQDWESDAFWAAVAVGGRDMYKGFPVRARIGAARALIDANIPWEHVTARNLRAGLADRYRAIYLPAQLALDAEILGLLRGYAERGGRVILDAPSGWYGYDGRLLPTADGSPFEQLFGCRIGDFQFSRANHVQWRIDGQALEGFTLDLQPTRARVLEQFADGRPAVTEHTLGKGTAVIIGHAAALNCWKPGNAWAQAALVRHALGRLESPYSCDGGVIAYRLAAPGADHFFLVNSSSEPVRTTLRTTRRAYARAEDPVWGGTIDLAAPITLPANGARWVRCEK